MGQNFNDYNASQIVPQGTLLKKFNKVIDYLKDEELRTTRLYLHKMRIKNTANYDRIIDVYSTKSTAYTKQDFNWENHLETSNNIISFNTHVGHMIIKETNAVGLYFELFIFSTAPSINKETYNMYSDDVILSDTVTEL